MLQATMVNKHFKKLSLSKVPPIKLVIVGIILLCCSCLLYFANTHYIERYNKTSDMASMSVVRELVLEAVKAINVPVVIEPKSGDAYIPAAKLYMPVQEGVERLTFRYDAKNAYWPEVLHISSSVVIGRASAPLYSAQNTNDLFAGIPKLQACQRGLRLYYESPKDIEPDLNFIQTLTLNNGKKVSIYSEKNCPELIEDVLPLVKTIKAY